MFVALFEPENGRSLKAFSNQTGEGGSCSQCGYVAPQDPELDPEQE